MKKGLILFCALALFAGAVASVSADVTVRFMTWEGPEMNKALLETFGEFEAANPGIKVELIPSPLTNYDTKIKTMLAAGEAPDLFMVGNDVGVSYGSMDMLQDWSDYYAKDAELTNGYYPGVLTNWKVNGKIYAFPGLLNTYGVFYNKKLLKEAGIAIPQNGWTTDEFLAASKKLAITSGTNKRYGAYFSSNCPVDLFTLSTYAAGDGAAPFANGISKVTQITVDAKLKGVVQKFVTAVKEGSIAGPAVDTSQFVTLFKEGKIPFYVAGQWTADDLLRNAKDLDWGFVANPSGKGASASTIFDCVGWASPKNVPNKDAVYKVTKFMVTKAYEKVLYSTPVAPAAFAKASGLYYNRLKEGGHPEMAAGLDYMANIQNKQAVRFQEAWAPKAKRELDSQWIDILTGKAPVSKLDDIAKKINTIIKNEK